jgi:amidohydrolase
VVGAADVVDGFLLEHAAELVAFRRHLHAHPELSGAEHATTEAVAERLALAGLSPVVLGSGTGLVCDVGGRPGEPRVALRADIDALAMADASAAPYRSQVPGVAHACGHDVHTAAVLGAGLVLARLDAEGRLPGGVRLIFEPSEEAVPGGAVEIVAEGHLALVSAVFAVHCDPKLDVGMVGVRAGSITSASDRLDLLLTGPGGHTARPERTVDLVAVAAEVIGRLPGMLRVRTSAQDPVRLVFGAVHSGDAANVIPASATLAGSVRTHDRVTWLVAEDLVRSCLAELLADSGAGWRLDYTRGVPPVVNEPRATALLGRVATRRLGADAVVPTEQSWGGDSFAWYLDERPGSYARLGVHNPASQGPRLDLHASTFDVDERSIAVGAGLLAEVALAWLDGGPAVGGAT